MRLRGAVAGLAMAVPLALAADSTITPFSATPPGKALPEIWREIRLPRVDFPDFARVADEGATVLRVRAAGAAGTWGYALDADPGATAILAWRWKVDRALRKADMTTREGDDFPARVYVFFDVPEEALPFTARARRRLAMIVHGEALPTAALCYVWDNRHAIGTSRWNPYTDRVRMIVLQSGNASAGRWTGERRDLAADFRAAFGLAPGDPVPKVTGIAIGADTDQTGEIASAWFGDFRLEALP